MKGAGHWPGRPSGSDLRNSRPRWPCEAILNCYNYRVSLGQWHHGVWASLTPPGATLGLGRGCSWGGGGASTDGAEPGRQEVVGRGAFDGSAGSLFQAGPAPSLCWGAPQGRGCLAWVGVEDKISVQHEGWGRGCWT